MGKSGAWCWTTTLLEVDRYEWPDVAAIYAQRWDIELRLRDVKTTLKMDHLRVKTPETARKTLKMSLIAYNLIKAACQQAAHHADESVGLISFNPSFSTDGVDHSPRPIKLRRGLKGLHYKAGEFRAEAGWCL